MTSPAPNTPSWDHSGAPEPTGGAFADTGAPDRLLQIWQATWDWLKGMPTAPAADAAVPAAATTAERAALLYATGPSSESKRVGASYGLGRAASAGCVESLAALLEALQGGDEEERKPSLALWGTDTQRKLTSNHSWTNRAPACLGYRLTDWLCDCRGGDARAFRGWGRRRWAAASRSPTMAARPSRLRTTHLPPP